MAIPIMKAVVGARDWRPHAILAVVAGALLGGHTAAGQTPTVLNRWEPMGPTLATILTLSRDPIENNVLYAGAHFGGLYRSQDFGLSWTAVASPFYGDAVFGVAIAPTQPRTLLVATQSGGMYRSGDGGASWSASNTGLNQLTIRNVAFDASTPLRALAATYGGVFRTLDGGATWSPTVSAAGMLSGEHILFDPLQPGTVYVGTRGAGVHRSLDAGATWQPYSQGLGNQDIVSICSDANDPARLWAATPSRVFSRRVDEPAWTDKTLKLPKSAHIRHVATIPGRPEILASTDEGIFAKAGPADSAAWAQWYQINARMVASDRTGALVHVVHAINYFEATTNFGNTFIPATRGLQNIFCGALASVNVQGVTTLFAGTGNEIRATSAGMLAGGVQQWQQMLDVGGAVFSLAPNPVQPERILAGAEGFGVLRTTNAGQDWASASRGMVPRRIAAIRQSRGPSGTMYAATDAGVFVSYDGGNTWDQRAQGQNPTVITDIEADPVFVGWVYYATADGRLFRSQDDGDKFEPLWTCPPGDFIVQIRRSPYFELYAVLAGGGVYASTNDGLTFFPRAQPAIPERVLCVAPNEARPWIAYVGTEFGRVFRTGSNGTNWESCSGGLPAQAVSGLAIAPNDDRFLVAGARGAVYASSDEGAAWTRFSSGLPADGIVSSILFDPTNPDRIYARVDIEATEFAAPAKGSNNRDAIVPGPSLRLAASPVVPAKTLAKPREGMYVSNDRGQTWSCLTQPSTLEPISALCIDRLRPGTLLAGSDGAGVVRSDNAGALWSPSSDGMTLIVLSVAVNPVDPSTVYAATFSSGIFKSTDGGDSWINTGPRNVVTFHVSVDPIVPSTVYACTSQGVMRSDDAAKTWRLAGQDTPYIISMAADPTVSGRVYVGTYNGKMYRTDDGGGTWLDISQGLPPSDINGVAVSRRDATVYAATAERGVYRSHDGGLTWWPANPAAFAGYRAVCMAIDPVSDSIYVGLWGGALKSTDHGDSWTPLPLGFGQDYPTSIAVSRLPWGISAVFVSVLNERGPGIDPGSPVMRSLNGGLTWTGLTNGVASTDALKVAVSGGLFPRVYLAAADGVYRSGDLGANWDRASGGLNGLSVSDLAVDAVNRDHVFAATSAGLFTTTDGGTLWTPVNFNGSITGTVPLRVALGPTVSVGGGPVEQLPPNQQLRTGVPLQGSTLKSGPLYVGTTERGVFFSGDDGRSWGGGVTPQTATMVPLALAPHPRDRSTLWMASGDQGVAVSRDRGATWALDQPGLNATVMFTITIDPQVPSTIYATTVNSGVWVSDNDGQSWSALSDGLTNLFVTAFAIDANDRKVIYAGTEGGGVFRLRRP